MSGSAAIVGVDLGGTKADLCVAVEGETVARSRIPTSAGDGARRVVDRVCDEALRLSGGRSIAAIGLAVPGVVTDGEVRRAPHIPGLEGFDLRLAIAARIPAARLYVLNDLDSAAYALAKRVGAESASMLMAVGLGTGVAAGACAHGDVLSGASQAVGEIGDAMVPIPVDRGLAPLETLAGGHAFDLLAAEYGMSDAAQLLDEAENAPSGAETADRVGARLELLAGTIAVAARMIDASHLVLFGGLACHSLVRRHVEAAMEPHVRDGLSLRWADRDEQPALDGALRTAATVATGLPR